MKPEHKQIVKFLPGDLRRWQKSLFAVLPLLFSASASAQQLIKVSQSAWLALSPPEREFIQKQHVVNLAELDSFGVIIDNQGVNESTSGTNGGAMLGGAVANAAYIDNAIRGGNYSATNQLAVGILGAVLGSALDSKPNARYHYRYAVRLGSGDVKYFDETKSDPFRHPAGVCVSVPNIALIDQQLCTQTAASLRATYLNAPEQVVYAPPPPPNYYEKAAVKGTVPDVGAMPAQVNCKLGTLAPVRTSAEKCELIKGSQVQ